MSLRFLLDSNVLSEPLRPQPNENVMNMLSHHENEIATATIVWHELLFGCYRLPDSKKRTKIEKYLEEVVKPKIPLLPYDAKAATWHSQERVRLVQLGKTPPFADAQIAAIAQVSGLILVTNNVLDYRNFHKLQVENWHK
ncbi:type II toxin-antitoxin system VapC family toxin [Gloeocapsa sp. PCC 73106]|uniref:type II toxin-antitoxin system VapC family toxin n=1 Tax=Gloeocapsa sp. PCC 73106 TaxID=102232 RepID=UPI0002AC7635|nr:type II toxin-antitoxin system VapC family toxin [Gloeocapsa sp. PCC 73106]ELS00216.1 putative nucleic acid-binding protein [Gloeocapsa sp. PCC 73106]